jgi:hypothetical protein
MSRFKLQNNSTLEAYVKRPRKVVVWRGRKFVINDPWQFYAIVRTNDVTKRYINGVEVAHKIPLEKLNFEVAVDTLSMWAP